jgi:hypothetical protein
MYLPSLTKKTYNEIPSTFIKLNKRNTHRIPDFIFLQESRDSRFDNELYPKRNCYGEPIMQSRCEEMSAFPELMENTFKIAAVMKERNLIPFFHGEPPGWNAIRLFMDTLIKSKGSKENYKYFRRPSAAYNIDRTELIARIDQFIAENGIYMAPKEDKKFSFFWGAPMLSALDQDSNLKPHLLSVSYAMTSNLSKFDSCFWFLFNHRKCTKRINEIFAQNVTHSMRIRGFSKDRIFETIKEMEPIFNAYTELKIGTLAVIGIPQEKISEYVYDSKSMGHPTGMNVLEVIANPFNDIDRLMGNDGGLQARLMLYNKTMHPDSGIHVILANDSKEVEKYCQGFDIVDPKCIDVFDRILHRRSTDIEKIDKQMRSALDEKVISLANRLKE